jgi:hypothetical protein
MGAASTGGGADASQNRQFWVKGILKPATILEAKLRSYKTIEGEIWIAPASRWTEP